MNASGNDDSILVNSDSATAISELNVQRPKLGYPAVFTACATPSNLIDQANRPSSRPSIPTCMRSTGSASASPILTSSPRNHRRDRHLKLDKRGVSGRDDYVHLCTTQRSFPAVAGDDDYEAVLNVPIEYRDVKVLHTGTRWIS
jgi:hypothetical protein